MPPSAAASAETAVAATRHWLERAVIGLNLCPFAKAVEVKRQIRYAISTATDSNALLDDLEREMRLLLDSPISDIETTLLIHTHALAGFDDFVDYLDLVEVSVRVNGYNGTLQVASFHPDYCFVDSPADDPANNSNRSPYPTLHLLREASIDRAVTAFPDAADIYERNITTLQQLGADGWAALWRDDQPAAK